MKAYAISMDAGMCGTDEVIVVVVNPDTTQAQLDELAYEYVVDHAQSYGVETDGEGNWYEGDEDNTIGEPGYYVMGLYCPEEHDMLRSGGGSFLEETGVKEAYYG